MPGPLDTPIGLQLARTARLVGRAFDAELVAAGGSLPVWLVLLSVKTAAGANQRAIATSVGVDPATLTHHLNRMEDQGLIVRKRDPDNRRVHQVSLTADGHRLFVRLATSAREFDAQLRAGLSDGDVSRARSLLSRLEANAVEQH